MLISVLTRRFRPVNRLSFPGLNGADDFGSKDWLNVDYFASKLRSDISLSRGKYDGMDRMMTLTPGDLCSSLFVPGSDLLPAKLSSDQSCISAIGEATEAHPSSTFPLFGEFDGIRRFIIA